MKCRQNC